ncbi:hypothetical protein [Acidovorax sp. SRB_14]|uniref:hypothetical protein n=1 Tax=Acidovorax sp. SRB_14 TaxID=1962699 RepID=UPI0015669BC2
MFVYGHGKPPKLIAESDATQCLNTRGVAERAKAWGHLGMVRAVGTMSSFEIGHKVE